MSKQPGDNERDASPPETLTTLLYTTAEYGGTHGGSTDGWGRWHYQDASSAWKDKISF